MVVTKGSDDEIKASVEFLKWFTEPENNTGFSIGSGYLPVTRKATDMVGIRKSGTSGTELSESMDAVLTEAVETVNNNELYTTPAFEGGQDARSVLEYAMSDIADADRQTVQETGKINFSIYICSNADRSRDRSGTFDRNTVFWKCRNADES